MKKIKNLKVGAKILLGYVFALLLMVVVGAVAIVRINQISSVVTDLANNLARDQHLADALSGESWAVRYYSLRHINQNSPENLDAYQMQSDYLDHLLTQAEEQIVEPGRAEMLKNLDKSFHNFDTAFFEVSKLLNSRQLVVEQQLDVLGPRTLGQMDMLRRMALENEDPEIIYRIAAVQQALLSMRFDVAKFLTTGDESWSGKFQLHYQQAQSAFNTLDALVQNPDMEELLAEAEETITAYHDAFSRLEGNMQRQQALVDGQLDALGPEMRNIGIGMVASVEQDFSTAKANVDALVWQTQVVLFITMTLAVIFGLALGLMVARNITRPLHRVTQASQQIADVDLVSLSREMAALSKGDLARHFSISAQSLDVTSKDELGQMSQAFNAIITRLQQTGLDFEEMAGSLRSLVGRVADNATSLNTAASQLSVAARQAGEAAGQVNSAIEQVTLGTQQQADSVVRAEATVEQVVQTINQVALGAGEQSEAVNQSAEMTTQMSAIIKQVAGNAQAGSRGALEAADAAQKGAHTVQAAIDAMIRIREKVGVSASKVQEMGQRSSQIGAIVETIDDIAAQTNLLALNAAIEAARAGEHGKGFAVVADEVRKLAEKSAGATKEIEGLIKNIKITVDDAVAAMTAGTTEVEAGVVRAEEARTALEKILTTTGQVRNQVDEIAGNAQEMSDSARRLVQIMETVSVVVEENTGYTQAMTASSAGITHEIEDIGLVGQSNSQAVGAVSEATTEMTAQIEEVSESAVSLTEMAAELEMLVAQFKLHSHAELPEPENLPDAVEAEAPPEPEELPDAVEAEAPPEPEELPDAIEAELSPEPEDLPDAVEAELPPEPEELPDAVEAEAELEPEELPDAVEAEAELEKIGEAERRPAEDAPDVSQP